MRARALEARLEALTDRVERMGVCLRSGVRQPAEDAFDFDSAISDGVGYESQQLNDLLEELQIMHQNNTMWGLRKQECIEKMHRIVEGLRSTNDNSE
jgi:hypothetical protein